jgi:hypothetical protein
VSDPARPVVQTLPYVSAKTLRRSKTFALSFGLSIGCLFFFFAIVGPTAWFALTRDNFFYGKWLFPYTYLLAFGGDGPIDWQWPSRFLRRAGGKPVGYLTVSVMCLAVIQYPCYGLLCGFASARKKFLLLASLCIVIVHGLAVAACFAS